MFSFVLVFTSLWVYIFHFWPIMYVILMFSCTKLLFFQIFSMYACIIIIIICFVTTADNPCQSHHHTAEEHEVMWKVILDNNKQHFCNHKFLASIPTEGFCCMCCDCSCSCCCYLDNANNNKY